MAKLLVIFLLGFCGVISTAMTPGYKRSVPTSYWYFKVHTTPKTWHEANIICQSEFAQLAVINSAEEAKIYADEVAKYPPSFVVGNFQSGTPPIHLDVFMLGFHEKFSQGHFVTMNGTPLSETGYEFWSVNQPDNAGNSEHCGSMFRDSKLNDINCDTKFMFICETTYPYPEESLSDIEAKCETYERGYKLGPTVGDRFYKLHTEPRIWDEASLICQTENAKLAIINSDEEAKIFVAEMQNHPKDTIPGDFNKDVLMLGFHDRFQHGTFVTLDGTPLQYSGYTKWSAGQPDNAGNDEHCGSMFSSGLLNDVGCNTPYMFVCEKPSINSSKLWDRGLCTDIGYANSNEDQIIRELECETYEAGYKRIKTINDEKYIKLHWQPKTWDDALLLCQSEQANLAVINSEEEARLITQEIAKYPANTIAGSFNKDVVMLGFHDRFTQGNYLTIDGKSLKESGFYKWSSGQPDNAGNNEHCGSIFRNGLLNDVNCNIPYPFLCEKSGMNTLIMADFRIGAKCS